MNAGSILANDAIDERVRPPLGGYAHRGVLGRYQVLGHVALIVAMAIYGYGFATYGDPRPFIAPLIALAALAFWVMPPIANPPVRWINRLLVGLLLALLLWPDYLALVLPGLPWITAIRLFGIPLTFVVLVCSFGSGKFRAQMVDILCGDKVISVLLTVFIVIAALSIGLSKDMVSSTNRFSVAVMAWFAVFFASCYYFSQPGKVQRFANCLMIGVVFSVAIGLYEARFSEVPWKGHIPWFLNAGDEYNAVLNGQMRAGSGLYRVQSRFIGSIGLGEFFGLALPFVLHIFIETKRNILRLGIALLLPPMFYVVVRTDSRLAFICFLLTLILSVLFAAINHLRRKQSSIIAQAVVLSYPMAMASLIALSLFWRRLSNMIWGGGAQQASTESRAEMMHRGIPMILQTPWGHGIGQGAVTLGYIQPGSGILTIDSYYLSVGLEYGVIGFIVYYGMFLWATARSSFTAFQARDPDVLFLAPTAIALVNFLISKSIFSQQENHPLVFMLLGLVVALLFRQKQLLLRRPAAPLSHGILLLPADAR